MTQLMLFDAPASSATIVPTAPQVVTQQPTAQAAGQAESASPQQSAVQPVEGVQRMGDLARLVLLRYQLVAQRRAVQAARAAAAH
ncbi:MAG: hypothetical protein AAFX06_03535 [Planctomycetota bacterium]